jgi:hypothetical protein
MKDQELTPQGIFKGIDTPAGFDLTDLVMSLIKTDAVKDFTQIEDWIAEGDIGGMTPQQIADKWDGLDELYPSMGTD